MLSCTFYIYSLKYAKTSQFENFMRELKKKKDATWLLELNVEAQLIKNCAV